MCPPPPDTVPKCGLLLTLSGHHRSLCCSTHSRLVVLRALILCSLVVWLLSLETVWEFCEKGGEWSASGLRAIIGEGFFYLAPCPPTKDLFLTRQPSLSAPLFPKSLVICTFVCWYPHIVPFLPLPSGICTSRPASVESFSAATIATV